jgi:hypothetical protein
MMTNEDLQVLMPSIKAVFGDKVAVELYEYADPEEGWKRDVVKIKPETELDWQARLNKEEELFSVIWANEDQKRIAKMAIITIG